MKTYYIINRVLVTKKLIYKFGSISAYVSSLRISRVRFYQILNRKYARLDSPALKKISEAIEMDPKDFVFISVESFNERSK